MTTLCIEEINPLSCRKTSVNDLPEIILEPRPLADCQRRYSVSEVVLDLAQVRTTRAGALGCTPTWQVLPADRNHGRVESSSRSGRKSRAELERRPSSPARPATAPTCMYESYKYGLPAEPGHRDLHVAGSPTGAYTTKLQRHRVQRPPAAGKRFFMSEALGASDSGKL